MSLEQGSLWDFPSEEILLKFGAKDNFLIIKNHEYWRFFTPVFVHIGFFHFLFNTMGLNYVGFQIETVVGKYWFLLIYLISGVIGNVASVYSSVAISAGASGALFGLLGAGYILEKRIGQYLREVTGHKPKKGAYSAMIFLNIIFGFIFPGIDNAAHLGGMMGGILMTKAMLNIRPNKLNERQPIKGILIFVFTLLITFSVTWKVCDKNFQVKKFIEAADAIDSLPIALNYYSNAIDLDPENLEARAKRIKIYLKVNDIDSANMDLEILQSLPDGKKFMEEFKN